MNISDLSITLGTSSDLPSMIISYGNTSIDVFNCLHVGDTLGIITWIKNIFGYSIIAGAVLKTISNIHNIVSGEANFIGGEK